MKLNSNILVEIVYLPLEFRRRGDISMYGLLKQTGYFERYNEVSEKDIYDTLSDHLECIGEWIQDSEDQRCSKVWYLKQNDDNTLTLVSWSHSTSERSEILYVDKVAACAAYIKHKIEFIRQISRHPQRTKKKQKKQSPPNQTP